MWHGLLPSRLVAFVEVAAARNFTAAARKLNLSQPALTRTIHLLEADIGARLFDRDPRNVELTPAGREVLPLAKRLLRDIEVAADDISSFVKGARGVVRIAAIPSLAAALLPNAIKQFTEGRQRRGGFRPDRLLNAGSAAVLQALVNGGVRPCVPEE
jgi:LysR family carnitine catabolism transcriptional activator